MRTTIGTFDALDRTVPVTFTDTGFSHKRRVNAVVDADGSYDRAATKARVADVALGVDRKRQAGAFDVPND
jgi:hypothetical protein